MKFSEAMGQLFPEPINRDAYLRMAHTKYSGVDVDSMKNLAGPRTPFGFARKVHANFLKHVCDGSDIAARSRITLLEASATYKWLCAFPREVELAPIDEIMVWAEAEKNLPDLSSVEAD